VTSKDSGKLKSFWESVKSWSSAFADMLRGTEPPF